MSAGRNPRLFLFYFEVTNIHCEKEIKIVIDKTILEQYYKYYFSNHPKAKKKPIEKPQHPSINQWMVMRRPQMNQVKGKWKDFTVWLMEYCGYSNKEMLEYRKNEIQY